MELRWSWPRARRKRRGWLEGRLMAALCIDEAALVAGAYVDLLAASPPNI